MPGQEREPRAASSACPCGAPRGPLLRHRPRSQQKFCTLSLFSSPLSLIFISLLPFPFPSPCCFPVPLPVCRRKFSEAASAALSPTAPSPLKPGPSRAGPLSRLPAASTRPAQPNQAGFIHGKRIVGSTFTRGPVQLSFTPKQCIQMGIVASPTYETTTRGIMYIMFFNVEFDR